MKNFLKKYSLFFLIICLWIIYHAVFFQYNTLLTEADSFSYIRMAEGILSLSSDGFWNGWFGFVYSVFLAVFLPFFESDILAGQAANMFLLALSALLFYSLSTKLLSRNWGLFALILFVFHPSFLYYRIHLLAENIYIPIFLWLVLGLWAYINVLLENKNLECKNNLLRENNYRKNIYQFPVLLWILLWLLYLTRAEGFIYIGSIGIIALYLLIKQYLNLKTFLVAGSIFFISFFIFISPYLIHLHTLTGEWGLTNKWAGNWRQAELRGREHMDDLGFEEAVAGLTTDNTELIAGFAWGMPYTKPQIEGWFLSSLKDDPLPHLRRIRENQIKLYTHNIPEIYLWRSFTLFKSDDTRFQSVFFKLFLGLLTIPFVLWVLASYKKYPGFLLSLIHISEPTRPY